MAKQQNIEDSFNQLLSKIGELPGPIGKTGEILSQFVSATEPLIDSIRNLRTISGASEALVNKTPSITGTKELTDALNRQLVATYRLISEIDRLIAAITNFARPALPTATPVEGNEGGETEAASGATALSKLAAIAAVAAAAIGVLVVGINIAQREFKQLEGFVKLFNPAVITIFHQALDNLGATIGRGFVPLFQTMTQVVRQWTGILFPIIGQLVPIIQQLSASIGSSLTSTFQLFGTILKLVVDQLKRWTPVLDVLIQSSQLFSELLNIIFIGLGGLQDILVGFIESIVPIQGIMNSLSQAIQYTIRSMYVFAIMLAKFAGLHQVVENLLQSVFDKANPKQGGDTAAQSPQIKSLEQLSKDLALAAASAGGAAGGGIRDQREFWAKTLEEMKRTNQNGITFMEVLNQILAAILRLVPGAGGAPAKPPGGQANPGAGGLPAEDAGRDIGRIFPNFGIPGFGFQK